MPSDKHEYCTMSAIHAVSEFWKEHPTNDETEHGSESEDEYSFYEMEDAEPDWTEFDQHAVVIITTGMYLHTTKIACR